jgi:DNA end-binding protein Ku
MARPIWTGVISFGLVSVPVALYSATRDHDVAFHQFQKGTSDRIRYQRVNERTGKEVDYADIVKGADVGGQTVLIDPDDLDAIAPGRSRSLEVEAFVDTEDIDPIFYQKTYWLAPANDETTKAYALLRDAMADTGRAAIGTLVMRGKQYLAAIRPDGDTLALETMYFADEIRDADDLPRTAGRSKPRPAELRMAHQLIDSMTVAWDPDDYHDTYTDAVHDLIDTTRDGGDIVPAEPAPAATTARDLMAVLRQSVADAKARRADPPRARTSQRSRKRSGTVKDLTSMTKPELLNLARERGIAGRSTMTRAQLERALKTRRATAP